MEGELSPGRLQWLEQVVATAQEKLEYAAQAPEVLRVFFGETAELHEQDEEAKQVMALETSTAVIHAFREKVLSVSSWDGETVRQILKDIAKEQGVKGKGLFMTVRVAVSGQSHGPDLNALITLLGPALVVKRLDYTLKHM